MASVDAYPLQWPVGYERENHPRSSRFGRHTLHEVRSFLTEEVRRLGGEQLVISSNMRTRKDGGVYSNAAEPDDSAVAVYFKRKGQDICIPCDTYRRVWENTYAIARCISAMRQIERDGIPGFLDRAFTGFEALPAPEFSWRDIFGDVTADSLKSAYRERLKYAHPDHGGSREEMERVQQAFDAAKRELGAA